VYHNGFIEIPHSGLRVYAPDDKQTVNLPVQGTAAVLANRATLAIAARGFMSWILIQCHDELLLEVPDARIDEAAQLLRETMEEPLALNGKDWVFPVEVKVGKDWGKLNRL
jgi:DNA polymerase-1